MKLVWLTKKFKSPMLYYKEVCAFTCSSTSMHIIKYKTFKVVSKISAQHKICLFLMKLGDMHALLFAHCTES